MKVLILGGTGFVGTRLVPHLRARGDEVTIVTRNPDRPAPDGVRYVGLDTYDPSGMDAVVNLAGRNLFSQRWNAEEKELIRSSRVHGTEELVRRLGRADPRPSVLVQASAIGVYGDRADEILSEDAERGPQDDFLARTCWDWEAAASPAKDLGVRTVALRVGVVLGPEGGALQKMLLPFKSFVGGPVGSGRQWVSWVHAEDLCRLFLFALDDTRVSGVLNGTAPVPVTMKDFSGSVGRALGRPSWLPVPGFVLRLQLGEVAQVLLGSTRVVPSRAQDLGFTHDHPDLDGALSDLLR